MRRTRVQSSSIAAIGYDPNNLVLEVEFNSGDVYRYLDVPRRVFDAFCAADSKGRFLNQRIKGRFRFARS